MIANAFRKLVSKTVNINKTITRKYYRMTFMKNPSMSKITSAAAAAVGATHDKIK